MGWVVVVLDWPLSFSVDCRLFCAWFFPLPSYEYYKSPSLSGPKQELAKTSTTCLGRSISNQDQVFSKEHRIFRSRFWPSFRRSGNQTLPSLATTYQVIANKISLYLLTYIARYQTRAAVLRHCRLIVAFLRNLWVPATHGETHLLCVSNNAVGLPTQILRIHATVLPDTAWATK